MSLIVLINKEGNDNEEMYDCAADGSHLASP